MLPLIPASLSLTILMGALLFVSFPEGKRTAAAALADDLLRHHEAVMQALSASDADPADLDTLEAGLDIAPFKPLVAWDSAIADEIVTDAEGGETVVAEWVLTWPATFDASGNVTKADLAAVPFSLRATGYRNSRFGSWVRSEEADDRGGLPQLNLTGVIIPAGAPVVANLIR